MKVLGSDKLKRVTADYLPRYWGLCDFTTDTTMSSFGFEDFIYPETCHNDEDFRNKVRFLEHGQHIHKLDVYKLVDQWQRFMLFRQNRDFENKFWLANYAADLDKELFLEDQKSMNTTTDFPAPIRTTFYIENRWHELNHRYICQLETTQTKDFKALIHEDNLAELASSGLRKKRFLQDLIVHQLLHPVK